MKALQEAYEVMIQWRSFELRPKGAPPISPEYRARIEAMRPQFYQMMREQHGIEVKAGPFGIDSRPALVGAKYAEAQGVGEAYHAAVFRAYWQEARSIEEEAVLVDVAQAVGLSKAAFVAALADEAWQTAVQQDIYQAQTHGLTGVPALVFAQKYLVVGAQPYEVLVQVLTQVQREMKGE